MCFDAYWKDNLDISIEKNIKKILSDCEIDHDYFEKSIKEQVITFIDKEKILQNGQTYEVDHFKLNSKDMSLPKDKRLDFDIWFDKKNSMIIKVSYSRMGNWEYRLKKFE